jgi:hypothetical protein
MPSIAWGRQPNEARTNPYEYEAQDQFVREAKALLAEWAGTKFGSGPRYVNQ